MTHAGVEVSIGRLPHTGADLFGREEELAWLDRCWADGARVVSIVAWGGVGKSALVNGWVRRMDADGWRGAERVFAWSFYSQGTTDRVVSADEFVSEALIAFGDKDPTVGSPWSKGERLARLVKKQRALLILDGMEPLQWGPGVEEGKIKDPSVEALVRGLGMQDNGMCLITSRIQVRDLEDLVGDKNLRLDLNHLSISAGVQVLKARGAQGDDQEMRAAVKEYDGHGLTLNLLGNYLRKAHKGNIHKWREVGPLEEKHTRRIMMAYEGWFKDKPELAILRMLGLFDRPATESEIQALRKVPAIPGMTGELIGIESARWNEALTGLREVGLLAADGGEESTRLDTHPLVREHFGEALRKEQPEAWKEGHRRLYEHLKGVAKKRPKTVEEMGPLYAAVVHGCRAGMNQEVLVEVYWRRILRGSEYFNSKKLGAFGAEVAVLSAFFDPPWERLAPGLSERDNALVLAHAGFVLMALGRLAEATGPMRVAVEKSIARRDWKEAATQACNFSQLLLSRGELSEALSFAQQSIELADKSGDISQRMNAGGVVAAVLYQQGRPAEAAAQFEEAERMQKERRPAYLPRYSFRGFEYCDLLLEQGQEAKVLALAMPIGGRFGKEYSLVDIGLDDLSPGRAHMRLAQRGDRAHLPEAIAHLDRAVEGLRRAGDQDMLPLGLLARAELHLFTNDLPRAHTDLSESLTLSTRCGFRLHEADTHLTYARLHLQTHSPAEAHPHLTKARAIIEATGYHRRDAQLAELEAMHKTQLLDALLTLSAPQLDLLIERFGASPALLPGREAAPATRAIELLRLADQQARLADLGQHLPAITAPPSPPPPPPPAIPPAPVASPGGKPQEPIRALHLTPAMVTILHQTALLLDLAGSRKTLLGGIDSRYIATIPLASSPIEQLSNDLDAMNRVARLADGTIPLRLWLETALRLTDIRPESSAFKEALAALTSSASPAPEVPIADSAGRTR